MNLWSNNNGHGDGAPRHVPEASDKYDGNINEFQSRGLLNNNGDENDASIMSETNDAKIVEEIDKASVKPKIVSGSVSSCNLCGKTFLDKTELHKHVRKRHTKRKLGWPALAFKCELCGAEDAGGKKVKDHIEGHHGTTLNRKADENSNDQLSHNILRHDFICGRCDETYPDQNMFNHHSTKLHRSNV